ncbi:unnamed protein product [Prorocentrum cordatum]|uniref:isopentenyl-diphosphate Delta-isomerase n=1 Tax=Prorocentrum cordatum TaxID=2364126 RepID=A0ABN9TE63_9DINO|nr:unnamed protein product [Polarella glacialis]
MAQTQGAKWTAEGKSQDDFMLKDECIIINYMDEVVGHDNKYNCHKFLPGQPKGILHRAFSVMLFDADGKILLQQRAASKITFPNVWTNTCCSHPLHGMSPPEVDSPEAVSSGNPMGVKHAAVRKLGHELGIPASQLEASRFKFITRVHYWAADIDTHGPDAPWGEHEIDYLLLYKLKPGETLDMKPHPDEVSAVKWLAREELKEAMAGTGSLSQELRIWSPWFRIIAQNLLDPWWADLDAAIGTDKYVDVSAIHRFDTPASFHGGAGGAAPNLDTAMGLERAALKQGGEDARRLVALAAEREDRMVGLVGRGKKMIGDKAGDVKQGAYGKVPTHSTSKLDQLMRPFEVAAALRFKFGGLLENNMKSAAQENPDVAFCDDMLTKVSRSFAAVIKQLPAGLCLDICVFYLVLRALDTVEDDMEAYKGREHDKESELRAFGDKRLSDDNCSIHGVGAADEATLIQNFGAVSRVYKSLPEGSREVIRDITDKMGAGMAEYVAADLGQGTVDQAAYDRYCHMVAGLVGEGLTRIFVARGMENDTIMAQGERVWPFCPDPAKEPLNMGLANSMGLFLQKTNIIRDYLEDYVDGRAFWPQSVWKKHTTTNDLGEFARPTAHGAGVWAPLEGAGGKVVGKGVGEQALTCLNELVADALELVPDSLEYLARLREPAVYRFCAIPQIMAMATLSECFNNPKLFTGVVKIRKGLTARLIIATVDGPGAVNWWFRQMARELAKSVRNGTCAGAAGPIGARLAAACARIEKITAQSSAPPRGGAALALGAAAAVALGAAIYAASGRA